MSSKKRAKKEISINEMANDKLISEIALKKKELLSLRFKQKLGEDADGFDTSLFKKARKQIARVSTELNKRNRGEE